MAMLAEPRRKQKVINLRAKNSLWSNDSNKFGQKMLEKMGWSTGKGLGAKEDGIVEHVVARYKNDERGLGYEDRSDQWTKHEDDFNALLSNLSNGSEKDEKLHSGISLEKKSKKSKARVHYHKFTRGKDLSRYSEKDLANIFGKKSLNTSEPTEEIFKEGVKKTEQVFKESGSMEDYFKNKISKIKSIANIKNLTENSDHDVDCGFQGFAGAGDSAEQNNQGYELQPYSFYNMKLYEPINENENKSEDINATEIINKVNIKKNKKLKQKTVESSETHYESLTTDTSVETAVNTITITTEMNIKKKKKKSKTDNEISDGVYENIPDINSTEIVTEIKIRKKNKLIIAQECLLDDNDDETFAENKICKKKSRKRKQELVETNETQNIGHAEYASKQESLVNTFEHEDCLSTKVGSQDKKKSKNEEVYINPAPEIIETNLEAHIPKKKKKRKHNDQ